MTTGIDTRESTRRLVHLLAERTLTPRQLDVWRLHSGGLSAARIAQVLSTDTRPISERTVRTHLDRATRKMMAALETELPRG